MIPSTVKETAKNCMLELSRNISINSPLNESFYAFINTRKDELKLVKDVKLEKVEPTA